MFSHADSRVELLFCLFCVLKLRWWLRHPAQVEPGKASACPRSGGPPKNWQTAPWVVTLSLDIGFPLVKPGMFKRNNVWQRILILFGNSQRGK